ncbi:MAG: hypothetical protein M1510_05735 [Nitrospirae bacterium]|nr:hypothetical protein [Nitrospirota bacterium]
MEVDIYYCGVSGIHGISLSFGSEAKKLAVRLLRESFPRNDSINTGGQSLFYDSAAASSVVNSLLLVNRDSPRDPD